jgi:hypothetical protein
MDTQQENAFTALIKKIKMRKIAKQITNKTSLRKLQSFNTNHYNTLEDNAIIIKKEKKKILESKKLS